MKANKNEYKIVLWTDWEIAYKKVEDGKYKDPIDELNDEGFSKMRSFLINYFLENRNALYRINNNGKKDYPFNGSYHQNADDGVPVILVNNILYPYMVSMRRWGDLMAEVWSTINNKKYMSMDEFWSKENKNKKTEDDTYCYLDFWLSWDKLKE